MILERIRLHYFRNYDNLDVRFDPSINVFIGENGHGKSNLLEAIYLNLLGRSFRSSDPSQLRQLNKNSEITSIETQLVLKDLCFTLKVNIAEKGYRFFVNGKKGRTSLGPSSLGCVLFAPESLALIKMGPELRRNAIDAAASMLIPAFDDIQGRFKRALKARNQILRRLRDNMDSNLSIRSPKVSDSLEVLESLDELFLPLATKLTRLRLEAMDLIKDDFDHAIDFLFQNAENHEVREHVLKSSGNASIDLQYFASGELITKESEEGILERLKKRVMELRKAEISTGISLVGPHKHDIKFVLNGQDTRYFCSQGQQRIVVLAFLIAEVTTYQRKFGFPPVLLLDDVMSELDEKKRGLLVRFVEGVSAQVFLTSTDLYIPFSLDRSQVKHVKNGRIF